MLRQFSALWIIVVGAFAVRFAFRPGSERIAAVLALLAVVVGTLGLWRPGAVRWLFVGWMMLAFPIGWLISHAILATLFYGIFTPLGLIFRLLGRDALARKQPPPTSTFWTAKPSSENLRRYFRQF
jgi:hypothetical protein